jgi:hypothetical protein
MDSAVDYFQLGALVFVGTDSAGGAANLIERRKLSASIGDIAYFPPEGEAGPSFCNVPAAGQRVKDQFTGDGTATTFTLGFEARNIVKVTVNGVDVTDATSISGTTLTFTDGAPLTGAEIVVLYEAV